MNKTQGPEDLIMHWWMEHGTPGKIRIQSPEMLSAAKRLLERYRFKQVTYLISWVAAAKRAGYTGVYTYTPRVASLPYLARNGSEKGPIADRVVDAILRVKKEVEDEQKRRPTISTPDS